MAPKMEARRTMEKQTPRKLAIKVKKANGLWAFTDKEVDLENELLINGADKLCDRICEELHIKPHKGLTVNFAEQGVNWIPQEKPLVRKLVLLGEAENGFTYLYGTEVVWLCENLLKYFDKPPKVIEVLVEEEVAINNARILAAKNGYRLIYSSEYSVIEPMVSIEYLEELDEIAMMATSVDWLNYHLIRP